MSRVSWVIEKFREHEEETDRLTAAVIAAGHTVHAYHPYRGLDRSVIEKLQDVPVAFHGSCFGAVMFKRDCPTALPGPFLTWPNYACSEYYGHWSSLCLNTPTARMYRLEEVLTRADELFAKPKFVRPDLGSKAFAGEVFVSADTVRRDLLNILYENEDRNLKLVLAEPQSLGREWRVFYNAIEETGPGIICGSQYRDKGKLAVQPGLPDHVSAWVGETFSQQEWYPDPFFVLDVVEVFPEKTLRLLEIGAANVAGLYAVSIDAFVCAMSKEVNRQFSLKGKFS